MDVETVRAPLLRNASSRRSFSAQRLGAAAKSLVQITSNRKKLADVRSELEIPFDLYVDE